MCVFVCVQHVLECVHVCTYMYVFMCAPYGVCFFFHGRWQFSHFLWLSRIPKKIAHKICVHINCLGVRSTCVIVVLQHVSAALSFKLFCEDSYQIWRPHYFPLSSQLLSVCPQVCPDCTTWGRWVEVMSVRISSQAGIQHVSGIIISETWNVPSWLYTHTLLHDLLDEYKINRKRSNFEIKTYL